MSQKIEPNFSLPEKWTVEITNENKEILLPYWKSKNPMWSDNDPVTEKEFWGWLLSDKNDGTYLSYRTFGLPDDYSEISTKEFQEYVLNLFILPEKWAVKRTQENFEEINKYFNKLYKAKGFSTFRSTRNTGSSYQVLDHSYVHFPKIKRGTSTVYHEVWNGYTVISFEKFLKYVVNKENKQTMEEKKIIGYTLTKPKFARAVNALLGNDPNFNIESYMSNGASSNFTKVLQEAGVLDLWFEPVYEQIFKVGDWVTVVSNTIDILAIAHYVVGETFQVKSISESMIDKYKGWLSKDDVNKNSISLASVRKATEEEIEAAQTVLLELGTNGVKVVIGVNKLEVRHSRIDIERVEALYEKFTSTLNNAGWYFGSWGITIPHDIQFIQVGCDAESNRFSLDELARVIREYRKINPKQ